MLNKTAIILGALMTTLVSLWNMPAADAAATWCHGGTCIYYRWQNCNDFDPQEGDICIQHSAVNAGYTPLGVDARDLDRALDELSANGIEAFADVDPDEEMAVVWVADEDQELARDVLESAGIIIIIITQKGDYLIVVIIEGSNEPVEGALVYDDKTNELLGTTDIDGSFHTTEPAETVIRVVEPNYGEQQFIGTLRDSADDEGKVVIGWDKDGNPIYE